MATARGCVPLQDIASIKFRLFTSSIAHFVILEFTPFSFRYRAIQGSGWIGDGLIWKFDFG